MLAHIACLWPANDICCFLWSLFAESIVEPRFSSVKIKQLRFAYLEGSIFNACQRREEALNECSYLCFFGIGLGFWLISDLPISGWSGFPHFQVFTFPVYASIVEPVVFVIFEVVALKSHFSDAKWNLLVDFRFSSKLSPLDSCFTELFSSKRCDTVSPVCQHGIQIWPHISSF